MTIRSTTEIAIGIVLIVLGVISSLLLPLQLSDFVTNLVSLGAGIVILRKGIKDRSSGIQSKKIALKDKAKEKKQEDRKSAKHRPPLTEQQRRQRRS